MCYPLLLGYLTLLFSGSASLPISCHHDYGQAYEAAEVDGRMLMIAVVQQVDGPIAREWRQWLRTLPARDALLGRYELALLPTTAHVPHNDGTQVPILDHPGLAELHGQPGVVVIDLVDADSPTYGKVVFLYSFVGRYRLSFGAFLESLALPPGSLTQRMLTFAVRVHDDDPQSADSRPLPLFADAATAHSQHQAEIELQGHHQWERRFQELLAQLPGDLLPYEVCAESWPDETLIEAAHECVDSWRQSSGHWLRVAAQTRYFAYDMKRGDNGIWYATGILAIDRTEDLQP